MSVYGFDDLPYSVRERLRRDFPFYAENALKIRGMSGALEPLRLNRAQMNLHRSVVRQMRTRGYVRIISLKARQQGISTYITGRLVSKTTQNIGYKTLIMAHLSAASQNLFDMTARYISHAPGLIMPNVTAHNRQQLRFGALDSMFTVATARNKDSGRSETLQASHLSEVAFFPWPEEIAKGLMAAIHDVPGTESYLESTADGVDTWFHHLWKEGVAGKHDYECVFSPWFWTPHYRAKIVPVDFMPDPEELELIEEYGLDFAQLVFRRNYISKWGISAWRSEMPATPQEAFEGAIIKGRVYPHFAMARNVSPVAYNPDEHVYIGMDFNVSPMSATLNHFRAGQVQQFGEITLMDSNTEEMALEIKKRLPKSIGKITVFPDPSGKARKSSAGGKTDFTILRTAGFQVIAPGSHDPVKDRINTVNSAIKGPQGQIGYVVDPSCEETIKCFSRVRYIEGSENLVNKREGLDHLPDAQGYLIMQLLPIRNATSLARVTVKG